MLKHIVFITLLLVFALLQMQLWGKSGTRAMLERQNQQEFEVLDRINQHEGRAQEIAEEIHYLRNDPDASEARSRQDLGMIKQDEILIFLPDNNEP